MQVHHRVGVGSVVVQLQLAHAQRGVGVFAMLAQQVGYRPLAR